MDVLVVEDDSQLAELLGRVFREESFGVVVCGSLKAAEEAIAARSFDIVVLDWMLPDGDGVELCSRMRARGMTTPVLMLTARAETADVVTGLRTGADDYVTKPFQVEELLARVEALLRRAGPSWTTQAGPLEIDRRVQEARVAGKRIDLTAREFALLARLADSLGECVTRSALLTDVWHTSFDPGSGVIDVHVSRLRDKLGEASWMVETVRGQGLRLRAKR